MESLNDFYRLLDSSNWDVKQEGEINSSLQSLSLKLEKAGLNDDLRLLEIDRQAFHFSKSPKKKLSFRASGTRKFEDGREEPFEWPNINYFEDGDFKYLLKRFNEVKNIYAKTEYGLVLFYSAHKQDNDFVYELVESLISLLKSYLEKSKIDQDKDHYFLYASLVLSNALYISSKRKNDVRIKNKFDELTNLIFETHQSWDSSSKSSLKAIVDLTDYVTEYYKDMFPLINIDAIIDKNWDIANTSTMEERSIWGAIHIADSTIALCKKKNAETLKWHLLKAQQYEKLALNAEKRGNMASISFIETAMLIYKDLKDLPNLERVQVKYLELRNAFELTSVRSDLPEAEAKQIEEEIKKEIERKTPREIVEFFVSTPVFKPYEVIAVEIKSTGQDQFFMDYLPTTVLDKFGNTIATYRTQEERNEYAVIRTYMLNLQIGLQFVRAYFFEALSKDKISSDDILSWLESSWMGSKTERLMFNKSHNISYMNLIGPSIKVLFEEIKKWRIDTQYVPNVISAIDSLTLKAEYFLREICYRLGVRPFKQKPDEPGVIMEKTLGDLLRDLRGKLPDEDIEFFKYTLSERSGYNMRNKIAHGLMDDIEYGFEHLLLSLIIILKLSNYQFTSQDTQQV